MTAMHGKDNVPRYTPYPAKPTRTPEQHKQWKNRKAFMRAVRARARKEAKAK